MRRPTSSCGLQQEGEGSRAEPEGCRGWLSGSQWQGEFLQPSLGLGVGAGVVEKARADDLAW